MPELRQELRLLDGPSGGGERSWLIYDPVRHRYFLLTRAAFQILQRWRAEPAADLAARCASELGRPVSTAEVSEIAQFLSANHLAVAPPSGDPRMLARLEAAQHRSLLMRAVHNYLFFRVPLVRPERFLAATMPLVAPLFTRTAALLALVVWLAGLYFASRQWDVFVITFLDFLSLEGAVIYGLTLIAVKALHELGHAYTATRFGVRVNTMGVAFLVMTPILYTDVTDAWRLKKRAQKLAIDAAGIAVELALAGIALLLWAFLPDGPMRSAAFVTTTTSLAMGLAVNLNPLMRFDGYYLLADAWGIANLQPRSNALAVWWLREWLFGFGEPAPEALPRRRRALLIAYAFAVWVYRFFLFLGIALLVYHMFFKVLGVILFAVEIVWFILRPIARELGEWWKMRDRIMANWRGMATLAAAVVVVGLLVVPWRATVSMQAVALGDLETTLFAPRPARVVALGIKEGSRIAGGEALVNLQAPDLEHDIAQAKMEIELTRLRLDRIAGDAADRSNRVVLAGELARHKTKLDGLNTERGRLAILAPHAGTARDVDQELRVGEWIDAATPIARIVHGDQAQAQGYIGDDELWRVDAGAIATFVPEDPLMARRHGTVAEAVETGAASLDLPYLASVFGGAVPSDHTKDGAIRPRSGRHLVRVQLDGPVPERVIRGTLHIAGKRESIAAAIWRRVLQVLVRESSA